MQIARNIEKYMENSTEDKGIKCICGHSRDGICHCCCENPQPISYEEINDDEYDDILTDFD